MKTVYSIIILTVVAVILSYTVGACYAYFYPMTYKEQITQYSKQYDVDAALIASIANVESGFNNNAVSNKGAIGVMQLLPSTAEWLAEKLKMSYSKDQLFDEEYNIKLGTFYLSYLISYFGNEKSAVCAYNAGQGNVKNWLANKEYSSDGKMLSKIPFKETENYLKKINKNYSFYKTKYKNVLK